MTSAHACDTFLVLAPPPSPDNVISFVFCISGEKKIKTEGKHMEETVIAVAVADKEACRDYSWIAHQMDCGTALERPHNYIGRISNLRPFLDSPAQTTRVNVLDLFRKISKRARYVVFEKRCFPEGF